MYESEWGLGTVCLHPMVRLIWNQLRFEMGRKVLFEQQMEIAYVSVLLNSLLIQKEQRILNSSFLRRCSW